jgi:hypothetical protein
MELWACRIKVSGQKHSKEYFGLWGLFFKLWKGIVMKERRSMVILSLFFAACIFSGCGGSDSGQHLIDMSGGRGGSNNNVLAKGFSGAAGGNGGALNVSEDFFEVHITTTGTADVTYNLTNPAGSLGDNPLVISENVTLVLVTEGEPAKGTPYWSIASGYQKPLEKDTNLVQISTPISFDPPVLEALPYRIYISDGNGTAYDEAPVTGINVNGGSTLTIEPNVEDFSNLRAQLLLTRDFINNGTVTVATEAGASIYCGLKIDCSSFINRGTIALQSIEPGQNGGSLEVACEYGLHNRGPIRTYGADAANGDAGNGGEVELVSYSAHIENSGKIDTHGGTSTFSEDGLAGRGGSVYLQSSESGSIYNGGAILAHGGSGVYNDTDFLDFDPGDFMVPYLSAGDKLSKGLLVTEVVMMAGNGPLINTGAIRTYGGDCAEGNGYNGGAVFFSGSGDIKIGGSIDTHGGNTLSLEDYYAGSGGNVYFNGDEDTDFLFPYKQVFLPNLLVDIQISANIIVRGGNVPSDSLAFGCGGNGGVIFISPSYYSDYPSKLQILGYGLILANGGKGNSGGCGGSVNLAFFDTDYRDDFRLPIQKSIGGGVILENSVPILARGGNGTIGGAQTSAYGGDGGWVGFAAYGIITNRSAIDVSGGTNINIEMPLYGAVNGFAGSISMYSQFDVSNTGDLYARGGNDIGTQGGGLGWGGNGGSVMLTADYGILTNNANIYASGGNGASGGGHASGVMSSLSYKLKPKGELFSYGINLYGADAVNCGGRIVANGGNGGSNVAGSIGGSGGYVELASDNWPEAVTYRSITAKRGTGDIDGYIDDIIVGELFIQEHDYPEPD